MMTTCNTGDKTGCDAGTRRPDENDQMFEERLQMQSRLCRIRHKIVVLSGKGGVGKSTVAVNLATALMMAGKHVGLLDVDIHGPSIPTMLGLAHRTALGSEDGLLPVDLGNLKIMSLGFLLNHPDDAVIWRGPRKMGVIKQFLKDVVWGDLDYLIIDSPPGTGDEPLSVCQLIDDLDGAVIVTTPQKVASVDVRKSISFCRELNVNVLGIIENMSGFACPKCGEITQILPSGGGRKIAESMHIPFLGAIPMDPNIAASGDNGQPFVHHYADSPTAEIMRGIIAPLLALDTAAPNNTELEGRNMIRIAIPMADGKLAMHFGHCAQFALVEVDEDAKIAASTQLLTPPPHEPGVLPRWLHEQGATVIIAGGMGQRAQDLFREQGITVVIGAPAETPELLVSAYLSGTLQTGRNLCDH
jgi:Mrp family chromosome partitioning ATPase/predicted Fe-Mo cluster-binding NifX family protein